MGRGGYLDKIYKILGDILDLKAGFPFANFFHTKRLFAFQNNKKKVLIRKKLLINENSAKIRFLRKNSQVENQLERPS